MKIELSKNYSYRNGEPARILCVDAPCITEPFHYPVISLRSNGTTVHHQDNGLTPETDFDLIEIPSAREPREWVLSGLTGGYEGPIIHLEEKGIRVREVLPTTNSSPVSSKLVLDENGGPLERLKHMARQKLPGEMENEEDADYKDGYVCLVEQSRRLLQEVSLKKVRTDVSHPEPVEGCTCGYMAQVTDPSCPVCTHHSLRTTPAPIRNSGHVPCPKCGVTGPIGNCGCGSYPPPESECTEKCKIVCDQKEDPAESAAKAALEEGWLYAGMKLSFISDTQSNDIKWWTGNRWTDKDLFFGIGYGPWAIRAGSELARLNGLEPESVKDILKGEYERVATMRGDYEFGYSDGLTFAIKTIERADAPTSVLVEALKEAEAGLEAAIAVIAKELSGWDWQKSSPRLALEIVKKALAEKGGVK